MVGQLQAGVAVVDITPPVGFAHHLFEIGEKEAKNNGIHDNLYAKILVLSDDKQTLTIVSLDLFGFIPDSIRDILPDHLRKNTLFCSTNNHNAPATLSFKIQPPFYMYRTKYLSKIEKEIALAIIKAYDNRIPVKIGVGTGSIDISYNIYGESTRKYGTRKTSYYENPKALNSEPVDKEVGIIRIDNMEGNPLAILVNYTSLTRIFPQSLKVSAGYPGFMCRKVEKTIGRGVTCFFFNGACGDVQPYEALTGSFKKAKIVGEKLADEVLKSNSIIVTYTCADSDIKYIPKKFLFSGRDGLEEKKFEIEVNIVLINKIIAIVCGPGAFYVDFQINLKEDSSIDNTFFWGFANGYSGFFPTIDAINNRNSRSRFTEILAGEKIIEYALHTIKQAISDDEIPIKGSTMSERSLVKGKLSAGTGVVNITPPKGTYHSVGKSNTYYSINKGILDSTYAKILVLSNEIETFTIVSIDVMGFDPVYVRDLLPEQLKNTLFCATHNHSGPATISFKPPLFRFQTPFLTRIESEIANTIIEAYHRREPAHISVGKGTIDLSYNKFGGGQGLYICGQDNSERIRIEPVDPEIGVIRIDNLNNKPLALLVNYTSHPVVISWTDGINSAGYPGYMSKYIENVLGSGVMCMFVNGACGDVQPYDSCSDSYKKGKLVGKQIADVVLEINDRIKPLTDLNSSISFTSEFIPIKGINEAEGLTFNAELNTAIINNKIVFISGPGEFYVDYQLDLKRRSPVENTFFFGYTNGYLGYFPTLKAWKEDWTQGKFEHNKWVEVGAGEKMIEKALENINRLVKETK